MNVDIVVYSSEYTRRGEPMYSLDFGDENSPPVMTMHPFDYATYMADGDPHKELDLILAAINARIEKQARAAAYKLTPTGDLINRVGAMLANQYRGIIQQNLLADSAFERLMRAPEPESLGEFVTFPHVSRTYAEQAALREKWERGEGRNYAIPGERRHSGLSTRIFDEVDPVKLSDIVNGYAGQRLLGNEPWHFEYTAPKKSWIERLMARFARRRLNWMHRSIMAWPRRSGKSSR